MSKITPEMIDEAMENEYDGVEDCVLVEEILELRAENGQAKRLLELCPPNLRRDNEFQGGLILTIEMFLNGGFFGRALSA